MFRLNPRNHLAANGGLTDGILRNWRPALVSSVNLRSLAHFSQEFHWKAHHSGANFLRKMSWNFQEVWIEIENILAIFHQISLKCTSIDSSWTVLSKVFLIQLAATKCWTGNASQTAEIEASCQETSRRFLNETWLWGEIVISQQLT